MAVVMVMSGLALFCSVLVLKVHHTDPSRRMPRWMYKLVVGGLGSITCKNWKVPAPESVHHNQVAPSPTELETEDTELKKKSERKTVDEGMEKDLHELSSSNHECQCKVATMKGTCTDKEISKIWIHAAQILDDFFFITSILGISFAALFMLIIIPISAE